MLQLAKPRFFLPPYRPLVHVPPNLPPGRYLAAIRCLCGIVVVRVSELQMQDCLCGIKLALVISPKGQLLARAGVPKAKNQPGNYPFQTPVICCLIIRPPALLKPAGRH